MSAQERARTNTDHTEDAAEEAPAPAVRSTTDTQARDAEVDALLDEIDDVLETNAEEFVAAFVQKGGQ